MKKQDDHTIVAIHVTDRVTQAARVQRVLTKFGGSIKTRIGLHEATGRAVAPNGLILLEIVGPAKRGDDIVAALNKIAGIEAKLLIFEH